MNQNPIHAQAGMAEETHWGRRMRCYVNRPPTVDAAFRAATAASPHLEALIEGPTRLTYAALDARIDALAAGIAGPIVVFGYWRNETATAGAFHDGWWKSGDIGSVDAEGFVRIADCKKDMINRGGFKVYPAEVKNVLCDQTSVVEAAVVGQPDPILGERSVAFVHTKATLSEQDVRAFCAARMAARHVAGHARPGAKPR